MYLGYQDTAGKGLKAEDLEDLDSFLLMPRGRGEFISLSEATDGRVGDLLSLSNFWDATSGSSKVLVSRFFAPKIATYYDSSDPFEPIKRYDIVPGWRKLVRLPPVTGSPAEVAGLRYAFVLFNVKRANADLAPYVGNESDNNQVILVPSSFDPESEDACYFAVYESRSDGYRLGLFLDADFDLPGHAAFQAGSDTALDSRCYIPTA